MTTKNLIRTLAAFAAAATLAAQAEAATFINIATASTSGSYYPIGSIMAKIWDDSIKDMKAGVQTTGGTVHNIQLMGNKEADVAFMDGVSIPAYRGEGKYDGKPQKFIRAMVPLFPEALQLIVAKDSGIKTLADFKGKRVSIGAVASGTEVMAKQLLTAAGIDPDKDIAPERLSIADTAKAFADKRIDAAVFVGSLGVPGVVEITTLGLVDFIDVPDDVLAKVLKNLTAWDKFVIPANTYKGQTKDVVGYASWNILTVRDDLDAELVYQMTKALYEHRDVLVQNAPKMSGMTFENVAHIMLPLHPGAEKYYREKGAVK